MDAWTGHAIDLLALATSGGALLLYQLGLARRIRRSPEATLHGVNRRVRAAWVRRMVTDDNGLLAIQTLRNSMMAASLMASTAVLLIFGTLNLMTNQDRLAVAFRALNAGGSHDPAIASLKILLIVGMFFAAFFSFAMAVRGYNHAGYLLNAGRGSDDADLVSPERIVRMLQRSALYYTVGTRAYFFAVPLVFWLFGPLWMLLATVPLLAVLRHLDHLRD